MKHFEHLPTEQQNKLRSILFYTIRTIQVTLICLVPIIVAIIIYLL
jgi:hypothetical protein